MTFVERVFRRICEETGQQWEYAPTPYCNQNTNVMAVTVDGHPTRIAVLQGGTDGLFIESNIVTLMIADNNYQNVVEVLTITPSTRIRYLALARFLKKGQMSPKKVA